MLSGYIGVVLRRLSTPSGGEKGVNRGFYQLMQELPQKRLLVALPPVNSYLKKPGWFLFDGFQYRNTGLVNKVASKLDCVPSRICSS